MKAQHIEIEGKRYHVTPLGNLPGVTTVLSSTRDSLSKNAIAKWRKDVGELEADRIKDEACLRGDKLHQAIELRLNGEPQIDNSVETRVLLSRVSPLLAQLDPQYIELATYHSSGYAGSPDLIAYYQNELVLFDWKTSSKLKKRSYIGDYILQVCAYIQSANEMLNLGIDRGIVVVITQDYNIQLFEINSKQVERGIKSFNKRLAQYQELYPNSNFAPGW